MEIPKRKIPKKGQKQVKRALFESDSKLEPIQELEPMELDTPTTEGMVAESMVPSTSAGTVRLGEFCLDSRGQFFVVILYIQFILFVLGNNQ